MITRYFDYGFGVVNILSQFIFICFPIHPPLELKFTPVSHFAKDQHG